MATGMTTHSHVCSLIHETIVEYEVVTASGEIVLARQDTPEHADLWRALPWSHGTLGFLVSLKLRTLPARPWVRLTYTPCRTSEQLTNAYRGLLAQAEREEPATPFFVEAIVFSKETSVLMTGVLGKQGDDGAEEVAELAHSCPTNHIGMWCAHCRSLFFFAAA